MEKLSVKTTEELNPFTLATLKSFVIASAWLVLLSVCYFVWQLPAWLGISSLVVLISSLVVVWIPIIRAYKKIPSVQSLGTDGIFFLAAIVIDAMALFLIVHARTDTAIASPWDVMNPLIFLIYALGSFFFLVALNSATRVRVYVLLAVHTMLTYGVSLCIYKIGFGYDPFVHGATMRYIAEHGAILPKQPFYIGEYVSIVAVHQLTGLSISFLQAVTVPFLSAIVFPWILLLGYDKIKSQKNSYLPLGVFFLFFGAYLAFTVPYNIALVLFLYSIVLLPFEHRWGTAARFALAFSALAIHPLLGIPAFALASGRECKRWFSFLVSFLLAFVGIIGSFALQSIRVGVQLLPWSNETLLSAWRVLSTSPVDFVRSAFPWNLLYGFQHVWPVILIVFGLIGFYLSRRTHLQMISTLIGTAIGMLLAAFSLAAFIRLPGIIAAEQFEFALRLMNTLHSCSLFSRRVVGTSPIRNIIPQCPDIRQVSGN